MITPATQSGPASPLPPAAGARVSPFGPAPTQDAFQTDQTTQLLAALARTPATRPEVVAQGAKLAVALNYPPLEIIDQLAKLIVSSNDPSETPDTRP